MRTLSALAIACVSTASWVTSAAGADSALAPGCAQAGAIVAAAAGCSYGLPVVAGDLVLVPKSCRHEPAHKSVDRHAVEVRALATGARVGQASLPPTDVVGPQPPPAGQMLPGDPPLLVLPGGIAAIDARKGSAELVFEPPGRVVAAARLRGLLALAEALPAAKGGKAAIEWTVLDLEAGGVVGQALIAGGAVRDLALVQDKDGLRAMIGLGDDVTGVDLTAAVLGADGKPVVKDGQLVPRKVARSAVASGSAGSGCPVFPHPDRAIVDRPALRIEGRTAAVGQGHIAVAWRSPPAQCLAIRRADKGLRDLAWVRAADGSFQLVGTLCTGAPAL